LSPGQLVPHVPRAGQRRRRTPAQCPCAGRTGHLPAHLSHPSDGRPGAADRHHPADRPMSKRILVFPCGSEIGLEIHRALCYSTHFELIGASSADDHGRFVYDNYVGGLPFHDSPDFAPRLAEIIQTHRIDALYPTMDAVAETLQDLAERLGVRVIGSPAAVTRICASKTLTYDTLDGLVPIPARYPDLAAVPAYPVFIKPDRGYGSRHAARADDAAGAAALLARQPGRDMLILEYLPGREWTVDCFSD